MGIASKYKFIFTIKLFIRSRTIGLDNGPSVMKFNFGREGTASGTYWAVIWVWWSVILPVHLFVNAGFFQFYKK